MLIIFNFMENDFFKPTHPTKVWKIPYFFIFDALVQFIDSISDP